MAELRGRTFSDLLAGLNAGQHLAVDALVAFVDGELAPAAYDRAAAHLVRCQYCAAEVAAQRQARSLVRSAQCPPVPANLLAALRDIPHTAGLPDPPAGLGVSVDGTVVQVADPNRVPSGPLGTGSRWGSGPSVLGRLIGR
jgi:anti-sigma factor RsiW